VLTHARDVYLGIEDEHWEVLQDRIRPFAIAVVAEIAAARSSATGEHHTMDDPRSGPRGRSRYGDTN
jgi:hypothetical protein